MDYKIANSLFFAHLDTESGKEKVAASANTYVRDKLRENAFSRKILPPQQVVQTDLQVSTNHDTMEYLDEIEPQSRALSLTFRGQPNARFISGRRYPIPLFTISSERFEKTEQELMSYRMPITKIIEDNSVLDIQEVEDYRFIVYVEAAVQATGNIIRGVQAENDAQSNGSGSGFRGVVQRGDFISLFNQLDGNRLRLDKVLIQEEDWNDSMRWTIEDYGDSQQSKVVVEGYTYDQIMGRKVVRTIKTDILQKGNIYGFTSPEFLGKFLVFNNLKFWIDKIANLIQWQTWEDIGMGFGNVAAMRKLELYNGQGSGDDSSDTLIDESEVGTLINNQAADGITFPQVAAF